MGQLRLFHDTVHLDADHFLSGNNDIPDPYHEDIYYTYWQELYPVVQVMLAEVVELRPYRDDLVT